MKEFDVNNIPASIREFIKENYRKGFRFCLVGGYVRDWAIGKESLDFDFEIRHINNMQGEEWIDFLKSSFPSAEYIGMGVIRIKLPEYEIELSSPRTEEFDGGLSHKNFTPHFDSTLSYLESFKRRDLRINAIGLEFNLEEELSATIVDPYNGLDEISNKICSHINDDFFKDPVRLLRAIRFSVNTGFKLQLSDSYKRFNLSKLTQYYFEYEIRKCKSSATFVDNLVNVVSTYNIALVSELVPIKDFKNQSLLSETKSYEELLLFDLGLVEEGPFKFLSMKRSRYANLCRLKKAISDKDALEFLEALSKIKVDDRFKYYDLKVELDKSLDSARSKDERISTFKSYSSKASALFA